VPKKQFLSVLFAGIMVALSGGAFAQETTESETHPESRSHRSAKEGQVDLGNVVISETETPVANLPASVTIIEGKELERIPYRRGIDALRNIPGIMVVDLNKGGAPNQYVIRGFAATHGNAAAVFLDGVPLNESNSHADGNVDFNIVIPEEIDRIEVIRGPFSALYGNFARGGSINIITKKRVNENTANLSLGYWDTERGVFTMGRSGDRFSQYYAVEFFKTDGYRDNAEYKRENIAAKWLFDLTSKSSVRLGVRSFATDWNSPGNLPLADWMAGNDKRSNAPTDGGNKDRYEINLNYDYAFTPNDNFGITAFRYHSDNTRFDNGTGTCRNTGPTATTISTALCPTQPRFSGSGAGQTEEHNVMTGHLVKLLYSKRGNDVTREDWLLVGVDLLKETGLKEVYNTTLRVRDGKTIDGDFFQDNYAVFTQMEGRPAAPVKVTLGLRYDIFKGEIDTKLPLSSTIPAGVYDNDLKIFSPKGGVVVTLTPGYDLYGNIGTGFILPNAFDKFSNPQLTEAKLISYEIGTRFQPVQRVRGSVAYYITDTKDDIVSRFDTALNQNIQENTGKSRRQGLETEVQIDITRRLMFFGAFSLIKAEFENFVTGGNATTAPTDFSGNKLPNVPRRIYSAGVDYSSNSGVGSRVTVRGVGDRVLNNQNTPALSAPGFTVADAEVYYRADGYTFSVLAANLFNRHYSETISVGSGEKRYGVNDPFNLTATLRAEF
jgi:iron complex outermembrane receptor protein